MYSCGFCNAKLESIHLYNIHQKTHRDEQNVKYKCVHVDCDSICTTYSSFYVHNRRYHQTATEGKFSCKYAGCNYACESFYIMKKHCRKHFVDSGNLKKCRICVDQDYTFPTNNAYNIHVSRYHSDII